MTQPINTDQPKIQGGGEGGGYGPPTGYRRPLERNVVVGPFLISTVACPGCGVLHVVAVPMYDGRAILSALAPEEHPLCPICAANQPQPSDAVRAAMAELRWRLDRFQAARLSDAGIGASVKEHRQAFLDLQSCCWSATPVLLRELERVHGNQQVRLEHEITVG